ncbi:cell surface A33 antigen isoform X1 [Notechis scutatus]|uniref:Cell surface A33 antigen isoform X1 n=1 Tax=Notechis scutatus TaxID=8663 RepID=A0A6J1TND6_9SAUR|nr:cell surface A33 antigen isoform X1 [Notechis scutatus]
MKANSGGPLLMISAVVAAVHAITVSGPSKAVQAIRGENTTLPCNFESTSAETKDFVSWRGKSLGSGYMGEFSRKMFDGTEQFIPTYEGRLRFSNNFENGDAGITLDQVTMQDNGTYECLVEIRNVFPSKSVDVELLVLVRPSDPMCKIIGKQVYGQNINLTCNSDEGSPEPKYTWQSYDIQNKSRPLQGIAVGGMLMLKNVSINTTGYYICLSKNTVGENKCNLTVAIQPPSMNIALYAGIIGGILAAVIIISVLVYCCCCRKSKNKDYEATETENTFQPKHENVQIRGPSTEEIEDEDKDERRPHV